MDSQIEATTQQTPQRLSEKVMAQAKRIIAASEQSNPDPTVAAVAGPATPHPDVQPLTPEEIDAEIVWYETAQGEFNDAKERLDQAKGRLIFLADKFGHKPTHADQSMRLAGRRNTVTVTRGTTVTVNEPAVADLKKYLGDLGSAIFERLFAAQTKHTLIEGARDLLKKMTLPRRTEEKVLSLFGRCIDLKAKAPSVKVEVIKPEKPAKQRKGKAAA